jgi:MFS superfamily sulfate permease-like transporter
MIVTLALVASLESTLSAYAVDKMDPLKRPSDLNRDMFSKGICNIFCGLIGGLPIITEIVRSSANISNGAKTQLSNFFHGVFIFAFAVFFPSILNEIPLASLAALLCVVGWRLAHPSQFKHAYKIGPDHIIAFLVTLTMTLAVDLLVGIFSGLLVEFAISMFMGVKLKSLFKTTIETRSDSEKVIIETLSPVIFSNSLSLRARILENLESSKSVTVNLTKAEFIDHTVMDLLDTISNAVKDRGGEFKVLVSPHHKSFSDHALASRKFREKERGQESGFSQFR